MDKAETEAPRVWVGCLRCYDAGGRVGAWVDATEAESLEPHDHASESQAPVCGDAKAEERWVFDHEGFGGLLRGECSLMEAQWIAGIIEAIEADGYPVEAVAAYLGDTGEVLFYLGDTGEVLTDWDSIRDNFSDAYCGEWSSKVEYAQELADDIGAVNAGADWPNSCIDWEQAARELFMDYWSADAPGGIYVFRG